MLTKSALKPVITPDYSKEEPSTERELPTEKEPRITCAKDLDDALRLYQSLCCKDDSVDSSLVTPKSINKAYFDLFKSDADLSPANSISRTSLPQKEFSPPRHIKTPVPERLGHEILRSSRLPEISEVVRSDPPERTSRPTVFSEDTRLNISFKNIIIF